MQEIIYRDFENMSEQISRAYHIARKAHNGQVDKAGKDYIFHPMSVASFVPEDEDMITVALLHDVVEDTDVTFEDLIPLFSPKVIEGLKCMTHDKTEYYEMYVIRLKKNPIALQVKLADLRHNMDLSRFETVTERELDRLNRKYIPTKAFLLDEIDEKEYLKRMDF